MITTKLLTDARNADVVPGQREAALHHFLTEHASSLKKFEAAEKRYSAVVDEYREKEDNKAVADIRAATDTRLTQAMGDCAYYRDRATLYGISAMVELARGTRS